MSGTPKVLLIDIETFPIIAAVWTLHEASAVWVESDTFLASFSAKWVGSKTKTYTLPDYHGYRKYTDKDDKPLVRDLWMLLNEADVVIAHNGDRFDIKKINARLAVHGFPPPSPFKTIDTLKIARNVFKFDSNKLDNLGRYLHEGRKLPNTGAALWRGCRDGDRKSWRTMRRYNPQDVELLWRVYKRLRPWAKSHPNLSLYDDRPGCPVCRSRRVKKEGFKYTIKTKRQQFKCLDCNHWFSK